MWQLLQSVLFIGCLQRRQWLVEQSIPMFEQGTALNSAAGSNKHEVGIEVQSDKIASFATLIGYVIAYDKIIYYLI